MPTIAVTGAGGFIGSRIVRRFADRGWRALALVRDPSAPLPPGVDAVAYDLTAAPPQLPEVDWLVHAAYAPGDERVNAAGTRRLMEATRAQGVGRALFMSSIAARPGTIYTYGRQKLESERLFQAVLRPGLVIGDGGLLQRTVRWMRRRRVVPLVAGGTQPLQTVSVDDLVTAVERVVDGDLSGLYTVADPRATTYRDVYSAMAHALGLHVLFVPVPLRVLEFALRAAEASRIPLGVGPDNLRGLSSARHVDTRPDLERLGLRLEPLEESLRRLLAAG